MSLIVSRSEAESSDSSMSLGKLLNMLDIFVWRVFLDDLESLEESGTLISSEPLAGFSMWLMASVSVLAIAFTFTTELVTLPLSAAGWSLGTDSSPLENLSDLASVRTRGKSSGAGVSMPMVPSTLTVDCEALSAFIGSASDAI